MKITDIHIENFGHWNNLELNELSESITVIYGPNEAGKSTLLQFIRAMMYGFSEQRHKRFVPPVHEGRVGGSISVVAPNGRFQIRRFLPPSGRLKDHDRSELSVRSEDGNLKGKQLLSNLLAGIDDSIYHNVFAVGLTEMQHLGTLSDTEAGEQLYGLAMGADRVSLMDVTRELADAQDRIVGSSSSGEIDELIEKKMQLKRDIELASDDNQRWISLRAEQTEVQQELEKLEKKKANLIGGENIKQVAGQIRGKWQQCRVAHKRLKSLGKIPDVSQSLLTKLDDMSSQVRAKRETWLQVKTQRQELNEKSRKLSDADSLAAHIAEIDQLSGQKNRIKHLHAELQRLETQNEEAEFELQEEVERAGLKLNTNLADVPSITDDVVQALRVPAADARDRRQLVEESEKQATQFRTEAERLQRQLQTALAKLGNTNLSKHYNRLQRQMDLLRHRMQLDAQQQKTKRNIKDVIEESHEWRERRVLPKRGLMLLGTIFSVGAAVFMIGLLGGLASMSTHQRFFTSVIGVCLCVMVPVIKTFSENGAEQGLENCEDELESLHRKLKNADSEIRKIDEELPDSQEPMVARLQEIESEILEVEEYLPLESQRKEALEMAASADRQKELAAEQFKNARSKWRETLRAHGLPDSLTPSQFKHFTEETSDLGRMRERCQTIKEQLNRKKHELEQMTQRVESLMITGQLIPDADDLSEQIEQLAKEVRSQRQKAEKRNELHRKWKQLGREQEKIAESAQRIQARRSQMIGKFGVDDEDELRKLIKRRARALKLRRERDQFAQDIVDLIGGEATPKSIVRELDGEAFIDRLAEMESEHENIFERMNHLHRRAGEVNEAMKSLVAKRDVGDKQMELNEIEEKLASRYRHWRILAATGATLDRMRQSYESERQPETLSEASGYLSRLTQEKYRRVWTPFGETSLTVDEQNGKSLPTEVLSRGTREQVFLSLRMALVANYARRSANLPFILDDVFVNFDIERVEAAAEAIRDFAGQGVQVLVFTCHEHVCDIFEKIGVDVRELPRAADLANGISNSVPFRRTKKTSPTELPTPAEEDPMQLVNAHRPPAVIESSDGEKFYYVTANELAQFAYDDDFFGDDGTFYPLAIARRDQFHKKRTRRGSRELDT